MSNLKSDLLYKARKDIDKATGATSAPVSPAPKWCGTCKHRYRNRVIGETKLTGANLSVCRVYNDASDGLKRKPDDVLFNGKSCPEYEKGVVYDE